MDSITCIYINNVVGIMYVIYTDNVNLICQLVTLKFDKPVDDPDALMQQKIPKSYLHLQKEIHDKALEMKQNQVAPIMNKDEFW